MSQTEQPKKKIIEVVRIAMRKWLLPQWKLLASAILANVLVGILTGSFPVFIQQSLDALFDPKSSIPLILISGAIFTLLTMRALATYLGNFLNGYLGMKILNSVQVDLFKYFLFSDFDTIHSQHSGKVISSSMNEAQAVNGLIGAQLIFLLRHFITLIGVLGGMIYINWELSFFILSFMPIVFYSMFRYGKLVRNHSVTAITQMGNLASQILETTHGAKIIRAYGKESEELEKYKVAIQERLRTAARTTRLSSASSPSAEVVVGFGMGALFFYVGYQGRAGEFSQGDLVGFITAMLLIYQPLKALATAQVAIQIALVGTERVLQKVELQSTISIKSSAPDLEIDSTNKQPRIAFENVSFRYPRTEIDVIRSINFSVTPNEMVALVGHSGGGKSTLFNLLERFYDVNGGAIKIDGQDIRDVNLKSLRRALSLVLQDVFLFDDSIAKNIAYARPNATQEEIIAAAKLAYAHDFIETTPDGYDTRIGENGKNLSGGQRQRISFARAALRNSPILLLDEPTSALDTESEEALQKGLQSLMKERTVLIIAHRLSTIKNADRILVVGDGQIVESGTHQALMDKAGAYKRLYDAQFANSKEV